MPPAEFEPTNLVFEPRRRLRLQTAWPLWSAALSMVVVKRIKIQKCVRFEVFTAETMKTVTTCNIPEDGILKFQEVLENFI
jgi:hypothetical protein